MRRKLIPIIVEKKLEAVKKSAGSEITTSRGVLALGLLAAALGGLVIGIFISPKCSKVCSCGTSGKDRNDFDDSFDNFWFDDDDDEYEDNEDADDGELFGTSDTVAAESNELNGNRSKFIKL